MVNKSFDFYKDNLPYGYTVIRHVEWDSATQPALDVAPEVGYILFVKGISFIMSQDFAISAGTMKIGHSLFAAPHEIIEITDADQLLAFCEVVGLFAFPSSTNKIQGSWCFHPPERCDADSTESFKIIEDPAVTIVGNIILTVHGWQMTKTEYNEVA